MATANDVTPPAVTPKRRSMPRPVARLSRRPATPPRGAVPLSWPASGPRAVLGVALLTVRIFAAALPLFYLPVPQYPTVVCLTAGALVVVNAAALVMVAGRPTRPAALPVLLLDVLVAYGAAVAMNAVVVAPIGPFGYYLAATVALWTVVLGALPGAVVVLAWFPVQVVGGALLAPAVPPTVVPYVALLSAAFMASGAALSAGRAVGGAASWNAALRTGRELERRETRRWLHDGVVQTLEGIALLAGGRATPELLSEIRALAADNAAALRNSLAGRVAAPTRLADALQHLAAEARVMGLRVRLDLGELPAEVPVDQVTALRAATAEALRNVRKHSGSDGADLHASVGGEVVRVEVRDAGAGFDPQRQTPGFGLQHSIEGRLREVGGGCQVYSRPGEGTRVLMWIPR